MSLDRAAGEVLSRYPAGLGNQIEALGNRGGFSGARLWRCEGLAGEFCLRAWPEGTSCSLVDTIHVWMGEARHAGLSFVPGVVKMRDGESSVAHAGRVWDVATWMPGRADFHERPTDGRLVAACTALAEVHRAWERLGQPPRPCPAVLRRLALAETWTELVRSGWRPLFEAIAADAVRPWAEQAWKILQTRAASIPEVLAPWTNRPVAIQPCLCDVWHDHVLFSADAVTGLVDYGSARMDQVAVDLARLLGSLAGNDRRSWAVGLTTYRRIRDLTIEEEELVHILDQTGTLLGAANWLMWLYRDQRRYEDAGLVAGKLAGLVRRLAD